MRIRQVKPSFFKDPLMAELSPAVRLFYIGLWMLVDDAGWFRWDTAEVSADLRMSIRKIDRHAARLATAGCLEVYPCGHARLPGCGDWTDITPRDSHDCLNFGGRHRPEQIMETRLAASYLPSAWLVERQVRLSPKAIADLIVGHINPDGVRTVIVVEVKAVPAGPAALAQLLRYMELAGLVYDLPVSGEIAAPSFTRTLRLPPTVRARLVERPN